MSDNLSSSKCFQRNNLLVIYIIIVVKFLMLKIIWGLTFGDELRKSRVRCRDLFMKIKKKKKPFSKSILSKLFLLLIN